MALWVKGDVTGRLATKREVIGPGTKGIGLVTESRKEKHDGDEVETLSHELSSLFFF